MCHGVAFVLYGMVPHGGTFEAPGFHYYGCPANRSSSQPAASTTIYCLYQCGGTDGKDHFAIWALTLGWFNLEWLSDGKDVLAGPRR